MRTARDTWRIGEEPMVASASSYPPPKSRGAERSSKMERRQVRRVVRFALIVAGVVTVAYLLVGLVQRGVG